MKGKIIGLGVSVILIVGVAIALVAGVRHVNEHKSSNGHVPIFSKAVAAFCKPTDFQQTCVDSLSSIASNQSATPQEYLQVAINVTIDAIKSGIDKTTVIEKGATDSLNKMAFQDCRELLQYAIDELQSALTSVGDTHLHELNDKVYELKNWLSATISYQESCLDGVIQPDLKNQMSHGLLNASELTSNALAMISEVDSILKSFGVHINTTALIPGRRLLDVSDFDNDGFPSWVSVADRRLLMVPNLAQPKPDAVVAQDGSGQFKTISAALAAYPKNLNGRRYVIYVKAGIYNEQVIVTKDQVNVYMYGDGPRKTLVTGRKSFKDGISTFKTATFAVIGNGFIAKSMGFQNTAGPEGHQAVALRVQSDASVFYNCRMDGYQDTLYVQAHRQFYRNCVISGTIDFIFGDSNTVIQNSLIIVRKPMNNQQNTVTAQGRKEHRQITGIVIHNCRIVPEQILFPVRFQIPTFLGRPWKQFARTVIMQSMLADFVQPAGWMPWAGNFALDTLYYAEFANRGPGADTSRRVRWKGYHVITNPNEAMQFTSGPFLLGDQWIPAAGAPFLLGLKQGRP